MARERLLLVTDEMEVGGSQRQITNLLDGLDHARWEPELLFFRRPSFLVAEIEQRGVRVHHLPKKGRVDPRFVLAYATLLRHGNYSMVHAFSLTAELWTALASMIVRRPPKLISSVRGLYLTESASFWRLKRFVVLRSTAVIANAHACAAAASMHAGIARDRIEVVANGVAIPAAMPPEQRSVMRRQIGCPPDRPFGLFVGRCVVEKNLACLIRALARLPGEQRPWMAFAGDGPLRAETEALAVAAGVDGDIRFLGERTDATELMQAADFLVLPSVQEGMSNAVLEAMASGCAVAASAVGGNPELIKDGVTGLLFGSNDHAALATCLMRLAHDVELRQRMAAEALARVQSLHSVPAMVASMAAVYERSLALPIPRLRTYSRMRRDRAASLPQARRDTETRP